MPVAPSMSDNGVHRPLMPLNIGSRPPTLQSKAINTLNPSNSEYSDVEICHICLDEGIVDSQLAGRLAATAIEQFLFFKGQIPFPLSRLATTPAPNERTSRKRSEFLSQHRQLLIDLKRAIRNISLPSSQQDSHNKQIRCVVTLGPGTMPKAMALFQLTSPPNLGQQKQAKGRQISILNTTEYSHPNAVDTSSDQLPPDSDSDSDDSDISDEDFTTSPVIKPSPATKSRPTFTPFSDPSLETVPIRPTQEKSSTESPSLSHPDVKTVAKPLSTSSGVKNENQSSIQALERRYRKAERDVIIAIGNMDTISDEAEPSKIHVYIEANRDFDGENWQPRPSAAKTLESLVQYPNISSLARTKLARLNACAVKVSIASKEEESVTTVSTSFSDETVWFEWDGKLSAVE